MDTMSVFSPTLSGEETIKGGSLQRAGLGLAGEGPGGPLWGPPWESFPCVFKEVCSSAPGTVPSANVPLAQTSQQPPRPEGRRGRGSYPKCETGLSTLGGFCTTLLFLNTEGHHQYILLKGINAASSQMPGPVPRAPCPACPRHREKPLSSPCGQRGELIIDTAPLAPAQGWRVGALGRQAGRQRGSGNHPRLRPQPSGSPSRESTLERRR